MDKQVKVVVCIRYTKEKGEFYEQYSTQDNMVKEIIYHEPQGTGDCHYADIFYIDGTLREFNLITIGF